MVRLGLRSVGLLVVAVLLSTSAAGCGGPSNKKLGVDSPVMPFEEPEDDEFIEDEGDDDDDDAEEVEGAEAAATPAAPAAPAAKSAGSKTTP
jgi:hypothetical protein